MSQDFAKAFYKSAAWLKCRSGYIASRFGLCERCSDYGDIVHHKILLTPDNINDPAITLNWEHLEYLCYACHNQEHFKKPEIIKSRVRFKPNGEPYLADIEP